MARGQFGWREIYASFGGALARRLRTSISAISPRRMTECASFLSFSISFCCAATGECFGRIKGLARASDSICILRVHRVGSLAGKVKAAEFPV